MATETYLALVLVCIGIPIFSFYIGFNLSEVHNAMKFFFVWLGLLSLLPLGNLGVAMAESLDIPGNIIATANIIYYLIGMINMIFCLYMIYFYTRFMLEFLANSAKPDWKKEKLSEP
jgi:uncharacterized membrane protein